MEMPQFLKNLHENKYARAIGALLLGIAILSRLQASSDQKAYWFGQAIAFGVGALVVMGLLSLAIAKLRPYALVVAIYVVAAAAPIMAIGQTGTSLSAARRGSESPAVSYVTNKFMTDWMSKSRMICFDRDAASNACIGVLEVVAVGGDTVDTVLYAYGGGVKIVGPTRFRVTSSGLCHTVPKPEDFNVSVYASQSAVSAIEATDQLGVLTTDQRAELWRLSMGTSGWQAGDEICSRYTVHDREGYSVRGLKEHVWKNGHPSPDDSGTILNFYNEGARLTLQDMAAAGA